MQADIYTDSSGTCAAFIANMDEENDKIINFRNVSYHVPAWSVSILPDCKNVAFNTAKVSFLIFLFYVSCVNDNAILQLSKKSQDCNPRCFNQ